MLYVLKSMIVLTLLYVPYLLMLRKESFFRFNRLMLLVIVAVSFLLPLFNIQVLNLGIHPFELKPQITVGMPTVTGIDGQTVGSAAKAQVEASGIDWPTTLSWLYIIGMAVVSVIKLGKLIVLNHRIRHGVLWSERLTHATIYCHCHPTVPFSWFRNIVISEEDYKQNGEVIIRHELGHIRHHHSLDVVLMNICEVVQWLNPFVWMLSSSLRDIHEYEADDTVLRSGVEAREYMSLLMKKAIGSSSYAFANGFNHSLLKKRFTMMLQKKSNPWMRTKALYALPVAMIALSAFATPLMNSEKSSEKSSAAISDSKVTEIIPNHEILSKEFSGTDLLSPTETPTMTESSASDETANTAATTIPTPEESNQAAKEVDLIHHDQSEIPTLSSSSELTPDSIPPLKTDKNAKRKEGDPIFEVCEVMPEYPGGFEKLMNDISMNIRYPKIAVENGVQARILISFVDEKDGQCTEFNITHKAFNTISVKDPESTASSDVTVVGFKQENNSPTSEKANIEACQKALCDEALRVCKLLKPFKPGMQRGENVRVHFTLPITFKLQ